MQTPDNEFVVVALAQRHIKLIVVCCPASKIANVFSGSLFGAGTHFGALDGELHLVLNVVLCRCRTKIPVHLYLARHLIIVGADFLHLRIGRASMRWTVSGKCNFIVEIWCKHLLYDIVQGVVKAQIVCRHKEGTCCVARIYLGYTVYGCARRIAKYIMAIVVYRIVARTVALLNIKKVSGSGILHTIITFSYFGFGASICSRYNFRIAHLLLT